MILGFMKKRRQRQLQQCWELGLYTSSSVAPSADVFMAFFQRMDAALRGLGVPPTQVEGGDYSGESGRHDLKRLMAARFAGISSLSLEAVPDARDSHADASLAFANLSWLDWPEPGELSLEVTMLDSVMAPADPRVRELLLELISWRPWSYGYMLHGDFGANPFVHVVDDHSLLTSAREDADEVWHQASATERQSRLRGVYPLLVVNEQQAAQPVSASQTLAGYIAGAEGTRGEKVGDLLMWWIPEERLERIRADLRGTAAVMPERLPPGYWEATPESLPEPPPPEPRQPNSARDALWELIRAQVAQAPKELPIVPFELFFEGNDEEDSIAPNQAGYGRPSLAAMYATLKEIADRPDVQAVLVSMHDDTLHWLERGETYGWPEAEHVHVITSAPQEVVERWVEEFDSDGVTADWAYSTHPGAPLPQPGYRAYTVSWD